MRGAWRQAPPLAAGLLVACLAPGSRGPDPMSGWQPLTRLLDSAVAAGAAPGAVLGISWRGQQFYHGAGRLGIGARRRPDAETVYDLASLTKVVGITTLAMQAINEQRLALDAPVSRYLPSRVPEWGEQVTIRHLLTHTSGLPAHRRLWELSPDADSARALIRATPLDTLSGARTVYSDLGLILLGEILESVLGAPLHQLVAERVTVPLGMVGARYRPPDSWRSIIAPTERDPWRGRILRGEVHDENAAHLGGVAGHAGLFGSTRDLVRFGEWLVAAARSEGVVTSGERWWIPGEIAREFTTRPEVVPGSSRALGWDTPSAQLWPGLAVPPHSVWHTGFTGTAIWVVPSHQLVIVLMTNRVHPTRLNNRHVALRRELASRIFLRVAGCTTISRCEPTT
jgi:CubicO group peptidase (beta-lactamase class C family)